MVASGPPLGVEGKRLAGGELLRYLVPQPGGVAFRDLGLLLKSRGNASRQVPSSRRQSERMTHNQSVAVLRRKLFIILTVGWAFRFRYLAAVEPFLVVAKQPAHALWLRSRGITNLAERG